MPPEQFSTCAYCPRLCRHVCPVAVATGRESATPTAMMAAAFNTDRGLYDSTFGIAGTNLCLGCGACEAHCKVHQPVPEALREWRARQGVRPRPLPLSPIEGEATLVVVRVEAEDWSAGFARSARVTAARLRSPDALGFAAWEAGDEMVAPAVTKHFLGRSIVTASAEVEAVAKAAGVPVTRIAAPSGTAFRTCHAGPSPGVEQLACCGRRADFDEREPAAAAAVAAENARRLGGRAVSCDDESCAAFLKAAGVAVTGPVDDFFEAGNG